MLYKMKLQKDPFDRMKNGTKTIEFRLYDEKRQKVKVGDQIEFSELPDLKNKLLMDVTSLYRANSFKELFTNIFGANRPNIYSTEGRLASHQNEILSEKEITEMADSMHEYYSPEEEAKYGVLGIGVKINTDDLKASIEKFTPYNEQEEVDKSIMLKYLNGFDDVLTRQNEFAHFSSSAFVLNKDHTKILMEFHKIYKSWAWPGGHADGDNDLLYVAMKESKEETGIKTVTPISKDIYSLENMTVNGHVKRGKYVGSHIHLNVTYLLEADESETIRAKEDENAGVMWVPIDKILEYSTEEWVKNRVYAKIIEKMKKDGIVK